MINSILHRLWNNTKKDRRTFKWVLIGSAILAGILSITIGMQQSVWFDEAYSILLATQPVGQLIHLTSLDTHPPLYYLLLKFWASVFGWSEFALRSLSVLAMAGAVIVGGLLTRKMFGNRIATGAVIALALSPLLLRYGFEIRMYSLASLIGISATYCLYSAYKASGDAKRNVLIVYGVLVAIGVYTLYYLALLWIAHVVWLVYLAVKRKWKIRALLLYAYAYVISVALFLPWLLTFIKQISNGALAPIGQPLNMQQLTGVLSFNTVYQPEYAVTVPLTATLLLFVAVLVWSIVKGQRVLRKHADEIVLLGMYVAVPILVLMVVSLSKPMYTERYLSHVVIGIMLLAGVVVTIALGRLRNRVQQITVLVVVFGTLCLGCVSVMSHGNFNFQRNEHPAVNQATASIANCAEGTQLIAADPYVATELSYYLPDCELYFVSEWPTLGGGYAPFSGSPLQIKHTDTITSPLVTYVYYGTPDQAMPKDYTVKESRTYGALNVTVYAR